MPLSADFVPPCIPTLAAKPPAGADWIHEIKHDGYRLQVRRAGDAIRLVTRRGAGAGLIGRKQPPRESLTGVRWQMNNQ